MQMQTTSRKDELSPMEVVEFAEEHIPGVVALGSELVENSRVYKQMEYHAGVVEKWLGMFLEEDVAKGWVAITEGEVVGMLLAGVYAKPPLIGILACDEFLYVKPSYRTAGAAEEMVNKYVEWAKASHAQVIMLCNTAGIEVERTKVFYDKCYFSCIGTNGLYEG